MALLCFRKRCCATICMKGCVTSGWTGRGLSAVLGKKTECFEHYCKDDVQLDFTASQQYI